MQIPLQQSIVTNGEFACMVNCDAIVAMIKTYLERSNKGLSVIGKIPVI